MSRAILCLFLLWGTVAALPAQLVAPPAPPAWDRIVIAPMRTSIYVGSVALTTEPFVRNGMNLSSRYDAKVRPWFFWGETGTITMVMTDAGLATLARGERTEFTGEAANHKNKPRKVTGHADPADATSGRIKVKIMADGIELIFNGTYKLEKAEGK